MRGERGVKAKKIAFYGMLVAISLVLSWVESLIPLNFAVPGIKMGLPNIVVVFALYRGGFRPAACVSLLRVVLVALLFGNFFAFAYSISGAVLSLCVMQLLRLCGRFGCTGVSVAGAVVHNLAQVIVAVVLLKTVQFAWYFPALCLSGIVAGICVGLLSSLLIKRIP